MWQRLSSNIVRGSNIRRISVAIEETFYEGKNEVVAVIGVSFYQGFQYNIAAVSIRVDVMTPSLPNAIIAVSAANVYSPRQGIGDRINRIDVFEQYAPIIHIAVDNAF